jgi:lipoprotein LenA
MDNHLNNGKKLTQVRSMWIGYFAVISLLGFLSVNCKAKEPLPEQIQGKRFASYNQWIYSKPDTTKKEDQVALIYIFEEVTALGTEEVEVTEKSEKKKVEYLKLKTVDQKEGYAQSSGFAEAVLFITQDGVDAFVKPTLTSGTKGKLTRGTYCLVKETMGEFSRVDCKESILQEGKFKLDDYWNVWITDSPESISRDPLLGETIKLMRQASLDLVKFNSASMEEGDKLRESIQAALNKAMEKNDIFIEDLQGLLTRSQSF